MLLRALRSEGGCAVANKRGVAVGMGLLVRGRMVSLLAVMCHNDPQIAPIVKERIRMPGLSLMALMRKLVMGRGQERWGMQLDSVW